MFAFAQMFQILGYYFIVFLQSGFCAGARFCSSKQTTGKRTVLILVSESKYHIVNTVKRYPAVVI